MSTRNFTKSLNRFVGILGATSATVLMSLPVLAQLNPHPSIFNESPYNGRRVEQSAAPSDPSTSEQCLPSRSASGATMDNSSASDLSLQDPTMNRPQANSSTSPSTSFNRPIYRVAPSGSNDMDSGTMSNTSASDTQLSANPTGNRPYFTSDAPNPAIVTRTEDQAARSNSNSTLNPVNPGSFNMNSSRMNSSSMNSPSVDHSTSSSRSSSTSTTNNFPEAGSSESSPADDAGSAANNRAINDLNGSARQSNTTMNRSSSMSTSSMMMPPRTTSSSATYPSSSAMCK